MLDVLDAGSREDNPAGLARRLMFVKGLLSLTNALTILDPSFTS